ncbi:MAG: dUTP diphosphatase [Candidatus Woesearchaeota archaeon]|jgi:dUTP pyrophosphatase
MKVEIVKLDKTLPTPFYAHHGDAGMDLYSAVELVLNPGERAIVPTGLKIAIPYGFEVQIRPRSGLAAKHGISIVNAPGTIDHQYRGELGIIMINHGKDPFPVKKGERVAQMIFNKIEFAYLEEVEELSSTERGLGGFGSTGTK